MLGPVNVQIRDSDSGTQEARRLWLDAPAWTAQTWGDAIATLAQMLGYTLPAKAVEYEICGPFPDGSTVVTAIRGNLALTATAYDVPRHLWQRRATRAHERRSVCRVM